MCVIESSFPYICTQKTINEFIEIYRKWLP